MEKRSYSYGMKITGVLLHSFFTIVLTVSVFLLASLVSKNILELTDIGTDDFLSSGYYLKCMEQKCNDLNDYLLPTQKGALRTAEDEKRYLQYTNEFKQESTNFCYWYKINGVWYTNQPDTREGQQFDTQTVLMEAKTMGDYLLYDMEDKEFGTDIRGLENYFFSNNGNQIYWPLEDVVLVIGVDTQLSAGDDLRDAKIEYERLHPWIKVSIAGAIISLLGWILTLVYLTLAAGHKEGEEGIALSSIDRIKTELMIAGFVFLSAELVMLLARASSREWEVAGLLVASGTISFLIDTLFLIFYLSMVRRLKAEVMWENSLVCWLGRGIEKTFRERSVTVKILMIFAIHMIVCFFLAAGAFYYRNVPALIALLLFSAMEAYILLRKAVEHYQILQGVEEIADGDLSAKIDVEELHGEDRKLAETINNIGAGLLHAVDDSTKNERMKADLITNVSHDIKTPLTSIINYVNLIQREDVDNERVKNYVKILDEKSQRLKQLTEDLVEASKVSSGNVKLEMHKIDIVELVCQTGGEFNEKFEDKELTIVTKLPRQAVYIWSDGRHLYRVIENLYNNVAKYALQKTRVYVEVQAEEERAVFSIKNVSARSLARENSEVEDLTERFIRGIPPERRREAVWDFPSRRISRFLWEECLIFLWMETCLRRPSLFRSMWRDRKKGGSDMVKAVIFDMDGVLIDTEKWLNKYWRQAAAEAGYDMTVEDGLAIRSLAAKYAAPFLQERFGADFPYWTIRERRKELMKAHIAANGIDKKPGVDELLDYLRAHRIKTAVATATDPARTKDYLTRIGIYDKFDRIVCATMVENGKPKPDIYLYACEQIGEAPADCIAVEDSPNGVRSATDAGIRTVMVPDLAEPDADTAKRIAAKAGTLFDIILMFEDGDLS